MVEMDNRLWLSTFLLTLALLAACQPAGTRPVVPATEETEEMPTPEITGENNQAEEEAEPAAPYPAAVVAARQVLAQRLSIDDGAVEVISYERRQWRDSCLGLGGADEVCLQAITPGFLVELNADKRTFEVRTNENGSAVRFGAAEMPQARRPLREPVVVLQRGGGVRDQVVEWRLYPDGRAEKVSGPPGTTQIVESGIVPNPRQLPALLDDLTKIGFFSLDGDYLPDDAGADRYRYLLSVSSGNQSNSIEAVAGTDGVPPPVWESVNRVESLMLEIFPEPIVE